MISQAEQITRILTFVLILILVILVTLICSYFYFKMKSRDPKKKKKEEKIKTATGHASKQVVTSYNKQSVFNFMEFDSVEDNMIVQKKGKRFLMVVECQGVNYDLMSEPEKISVEEGFLQFLNTLRHPIQLYIQTRTINLEKSIIGYRDRLKEIETKLEKMEHEYEQKQKSGVYTKAQLEEIFYEIVKQRNLSEYGKDIIFDTEKMNLNKNVLSKKYYVIVPYYTEDLGSENFDKEEIRGIAFSELFTRAQSVIRTLSISGVDARILDSEELVDLLYTAYNRDEAEVFGIERALKSGYNELYSTAPDVLDRKMRQLKAEVDRKALESANERIMHASKKELEIEALAKDMEPLINEKVKAILEENKAYIGDTVADIALEDLEKEIRQAEEQKNKTEEGGNSNVGQEKKKRTRRSSKAI